MTAPLPPSLRVVVLGSGSAGNATAISDGRATLLVDCGFSAREMRRRMAASGLDPASVVAILLTHEHSDHVRGVEVFARRRQVPVYATPGTRRACGLDSLAPDVRSMRPGDEHTIACFRVVPFATSHDAVQPCGFRVESAQGERVGIATDTGTLTPEAAEALEECDVLGIESNHDIAMLHAGPYPAFLKRRIASARGHLSNADAADAAEQLVNPRLRRIVALHRSATNNTRDLVVEGLCTRLHAVGFSGEVLAAEQCEPCASDPVGAPARLFD